MANRSMLFAVSSQPTVDERPQRILPLGEFTWSIPTVCKLVVSANSRVCPSVVWELNEPVAIAGDLVAGVARLVELRATLENTERSVPAIDEAIEYLTKPHLKDYDCLLLEPHEILDIDDRPLQMQMNLLLEQINSLDLRSIATRSEILASQEEWGKGCWSSILYYQPGGSVKPPLDRSETSVITNASHVLENASVWSECSAISRVSLSGFDDDAQLLSDALECLKAIPCSFDLSLSGKTDHLPDILCDLTQLTGLSIGSMGLTHLPNWLSNLRQLKTFRVQKNDFREFPNVIKDLPSLSILSIWGHAFGAIPDWLGELSGLESLLIKECELSTFPRCLLSLTKLKLLDISTNPQLTSLPTEIRRLTNLQTLKMSGCGLTELPAELADLPSLRELFVPRNKLTSLPEKLWSRSLDTLSVSGNELQQPSDGANAKQFWI